jgi:hypothetical protein
MLAAHDGLEGKSPGIATPPRPLITVPRLSLSGEARPGSIANVEGERAMSSRKPFYFGNAKVDQVRDSGWFIGQFIPPEFGLRRQGEVELKWGIHPDGEKRRQPVANGNGTTISVLIEGGFKVTFHVDGSLEDVTLRTKGDYVIFGPDVVHSWEAIGDAIVLSVRFPSSR